MTDIQHTTSFCPITEGEVPPAALAGRSQANGTPADLSVRARMEKLTILVPLAIALFEGCAYPVLLSFGEGRGFGSRSIFALLE